MTIRKAVTLATDAIVLAAGAFAVNEEGLIVIGHPSFEVWSDAMAQASRLVRGAGFLVGDLIVWGEEAFGEEASQVVDMGSWDERKAGVYAWLSKQIPKERRRLHLFPRGGIDQHIAVAHLPAEEQVDWLEKAAAEDWTVRETRQHLSAAGKTKKKAPQTVYLLEVVCPTEAARVALQATLEADGYVCRVK